MPRSRLPMLMLRLPSIRPTQLTTATWVVLLGYFILVGGAPGAEFNGWIRALNGAIAMILIVRWAITAPREHDPIDLGMLLALLVFLAACVVSGFPRQSLDAAIQVTAIVAAFHFARRALSGEVRASVENAAAWLCVGLSILVCLAWGRAWGDWLLASGGAAPPFSLPLLTGPFGNRHDVALLLVLLSPALWSVTFRRHRGIAILGTILVMAAVLIDSSRNVELAALAATAVIVIAYRLRLSPQTQRAAAMLVLLGGITAIAVAISSPAVMSRMANIAKVMARFSLWNDAATVWVAHPVAGIGPGAFPFSYMLSDHFQSSLFDPRHPDNALVQLLVEGGLVGVAAAGICFLTLVRGARARYRAEPGAAWAILVFGFATIGANPTDFVFLLVPALVWAAILVPAPPLRSSESETPSIATRSAPRRPFVATALVIIALVVAVSGAAGISYEIGRDAYLRGDDVAAESALGISRVLDPGLAIYAREWASVEFARGELDRAVAGYRQSLRISPLDPVALRGLSLALLQGGEVRAAAAAAEQAVSLMALSPENELVRAATAQADPLAFDRAMRVVLQRSPWYAAVTWDHTVLTFVDRARVVHDAVDPPGSGGSDNPFLGEEVLAIFANRPDIAGALVTGAGSFQGSSAAAAGALVECDVDRSLRLLKNAGKSELEAGGYWIVRPLVFAASGLPEKDRERAKALSLRFWGLTDGPGPNVTTALAGNISDAWRYRRISFGVTTPGATLPSVRAGLWTLLTDPTSALRQFGTEWPPTCDRSSG